MLSLTANEITALKTILASRQPNFGLTRSFYHDDLLYRAEMEFIWRRAGCSQATRARFPTRAITSSTMWAVTRSSSSVMTAEG